MGDSCLFILIVVLIFILGGEPSLYDAVIHYLMGER